MEFCHPSFPFSSTTSLKIKLQKTATLNQVTPGIFEGYSFSSSNISAFNFNLAFSHPAPLRLENLS